MTVQYKPTLFDFVIVFIFIIIGTFFSLKFISLKFMVHKTVKDKLFVVVMQNNKLVYKDEISKDKVIKLNEAMVEIKENKVRIKESNCPFKVCVNTGWIWKEHQHIICVPNKIYVKLTSSTKDGIDSVSY